ncbi:MAG: hemerythrin domain-containing protein [Candidatus Aenigmarchaeota archaeon]|nr:hemerythrin domain-containing protein [Candidatus Aenigmarchaeota archaeon]
MTGVFFHNTIGFIREYADRFHHTKEEDILFKEFNKFSENAHCNPVEQMLYEHDLGRGFVKGMETALKNEDKADLVKNALGYAQLLKEHIYKEDNILYPMTEEILSARIKNQIQKKFDIINKKKAGAQKQHLAFVKSLRLNTK